MITIALILVGICLGVASQTLYGFGCTILICLGVVLDRAWQEHLK